MRGGWKIWRLSLAVCTALGATGVGTAAAQGLPPSSALITSTMVSEMRELIEHPIIGIALKLNNMRHEGLTETQIQALDRQWFDEAESAGDKLLVAAVMSNALSNHSMRVLGTSLGLFSEFVVADRHGLTAGTSHMMQDYYQADEEWFTAAFEMRPGEVWSSGSTFDEATGTWRKQLSFPIHIGGASTAQGVVRIEVNMTELARRSVL